MVTEGGAPPGPSWNEDPPPGGGRRRQIDGSNTGPTLPAYMDPDGDFGELRILRIQGVADIGNESRPKDLPERPFLIRKSVERWVNGRIDGAFPERGGRSYALKVRSEKAAERLLKMTALIDGTPIQVTLHPALNTCRCVVSCRSVINEKEEELLAELQEQGVRAMEVRRIKRRENGQTVNTPTLIVTVEGTCCPPEIDFGYVRCQTRPYYPNPMQCFNCWAFGHTRLRCRSPKPICGRCSGEHEIAEDRSCANSMYCRQCQTEEHSIGSRSCPAYQRETHIQRIKVDRGLSYPQARELFDRENGVRGKSYAGIANASVETQLKELQAQISELAKVVQRKDEEIAQLRTAAAEAQQKDIVITQLQAALASRSGNAPAPAVVPTFQQPSLESIQKIMEQTMAKMMRSMLESNIETQRRLAEQKAPPQNETAVNEVLVSLAENVKANRKKNRKNRKASSPPVEDVALSRAPPPEPESNQAVSEDVIIEDFSSDDSQEDPQFNNTVIDLNISSNEISDKDFVEELSDGSPEATKVNVPVAASTPLTETENNAPLQSETPKRPINKASTSQPKTSKRPFAEMSPFEPGRRTRPPIQSKVQRQRQERGS